MQGHVKDKPIDYILSDAAVAISLNTSFHRLTMPHQAN
jgi:hypothetical protein